MDVALFRARTAVEQSDDTIAALSQKLQQLRREAYYTQEVEEYDRCLAYLTFEVVCRLTEGTDTLFGDDREARNLLMRGLLWSDPHESLVRAATRVERA